MKINEIFLSLQGEGRLLGTPSIFIRTSGCSMNCPYCDSKPASRCLEEPLFNINSEREVVEFANIIADRYIDSNCNEVIITGGEPLLRENWEPLRMLCAYLSNKYNYYISFETTMMPDIKDFKKTNVFEVYKEFMEKMNLFTEDEEKGNSYKYYSDKLNLVVVCPKLDSICYLNPVTEDEILDYYFPICDTDTFFLNDTIIDYKIVYYKDVEHMILKAVERVEEHYCGFEEIRNNLFIMPFTPIGDNFNEVEWYKSCKQTVEFCKNHGFRYTPRTHIDLYGLRRGV